MIDLGRIGDALRQWWPPYLRRKLRRVEADALRRGQECDAAVRDYWEVVEAADQAGFDCFNLEPKGDKGRIPVM